MYGGMEKCEACSIIKSRYELPSKQFPLGKFNYYKYCGKSKYALNVKYISDGELTCEEMMIKNLLE